MRFSFRHTILMAAIVEKGMLADACASYHGRSWMAGVAFGYVNSQN
jgi:hypothetical protein